MRRAILFVLAMAPVAVFSQEHRWELTPTVGLRWGGDIILQEDAYQPGTYQVDLARGGELGIRGSFLLSRRFGLELMFSRQYSELEDQDGLFGEQPGSTTPPGATGTLSTDVSTWQAGLTWHILTGATRPYLTLAGGQTKIDSSTPLPEETASTIALGAGVKVEMSNHLGLLFELRYSRSSTDDGNAQIVQWEHRDCSGGQCQYTYRYDDTFSQTSLVAGLVVAF